MKHTQIAGKTFQLEQPCPPKVPLAAYAVSSNGVIAEKQTISEKGTFAFSEKLTRQATVFIAPDQEGREAPKTMADLEGLEAYRPVFKAGSNEGLISLMPVPDYLIDRWFFCFCRVRGRVVREFCFSLPRFPFGSQKICFTLPVCTARVHVCRIKPRFLELPDADIFRLRDILTDIPVAGPRRPFPPTPPELLGASRQRFQAAAFTAPVVAPPISEAFAFQLQSGSVDLLRKAFDTHFDELRPLIPHFDWCSLFYRCEEIMVAEVGEDGYFDKGFWHRCAGDEDLYFWVEYLFDGNWVTVYRPALCTGAFWNYVCGTAVTLKITDPRVSGCRPLRGRFFEVTRVGTGAFIPLISPATGLVHGLSGSAFGDVPEGRDNAQFQRPFGKTLAINGDFGANLPDADIATHYRVAVKPEGLPDIEANWTVLENTITRTYVDNVEGADGITRAVYGSFVLNDAAHPGYYKIPMDDAAMQAEIPVPAAPQILVDRDWYDAAEFNIAAWDTSAITNGVYQLRIELCRAVSGNLQPVAVRREIFQTPKPTNFLESDLAPEDNLYHHIAPAGTAQGFVVKLAIDNRSCTSAIDDAQVNGAAADPNCGLLFTNLGGTNTARLGFRAAHPDNKGTFYFGMVRGNGQTNGLEDVHTSGVLGDNPALNNYTLAGDNYSRNNFNAGDWLRAGACAQGGAFAETLSVLAMATDGSSRISAYDAPFRTAAFAIVQECTCPD